MAERFVGTPYDPDPLGAYVRKKVIVYDEEVDCMYLTFRAVELALSQNEEEAMKVALEKRFFTKGILGPDGKVLNYDERYQYGEDMIDSKKFGEEITSVIGRTVSIKGSRGRALIKIIPASEIKNIINKFKSGDIVFFVKKPEKRILGEIVGHIGIIKVEKDNIYLIHASGRKNGKGTTVKVPFLDYIKDMDFLGIKVTRFKAP
ncbi:MAG: N-acetylmuramoyl-L-alanine amidase-like domain-containing protein [Thermodesulfovibrionales bacterium]